VLESKPPLRSSKTNRPLIASVWVFLLNAVLSLIAAVAISRWKRERLVSAMRIGLQYVSQSAHLKGVLLRIAIFFFTSTGLLALLPLVARGLHGGGAGTFTLLLACMGAGAITTTGFIPGLRHQFSRDGLILSGAALLSLAMLMIALTPHTWVAAPAMLCAGAAWIITANTLTVSAQIGLPDWVRARGMSMYQMAIMGASASGAAVWGQVATLSSVSISVALAAVTGVLTMALVSRLIPGQGMVEDLTPSHLFKMPQAEVPPAEGHVMVMIEYQIDAARTTEFHALMRESRSSRLRHGALSWELLQDINEPGRFVEMIEDESWTDHLRRFDRKTAADVAMHDRKLAFHIDTSRPRVTRSIMASTL
jgi:quinol monooxygenase YgiN